MLTLRDVQQYVYGLGIVAAGHVYIGKLDSKKDKSIGVYHRQGSGPPAIALGGIENSSYGVLRASFLVHWNKNPVEAEKAAQGLYEALLRYQSGAMGDAEVNFIRLEVPEPVDVGTDDGGVYEYVIWADLIYKREE